MRYRTIPFVRPRFKSRQRRTVSPVIPPGALMNGLEPMVGIGARAWGREGPRSGLMGRYSPEFPNSSFLNGPSGTTGVTSAPVIVVAAPLTPTSPPVPIRGIAIPPIPDTNKATAIMRPDTTKAPGFPGFFQWMAEFSPPLFQKAIAATPPHLISATKVLRTGGATLQGLREIYAGPSFSDRAGLGDTSAYSAYASTGNSVTTNVTPPLVSVTADPGVLQTVPITDTGETTGAPTQSSTGTAQLVSALVSAGQTVLTDVNQQTLFNTNLARAAAGLAPLTSTGSTITGVAATSSTTMLLIGGAALLVIVMMSRGSKSP